MNNNLKRRIFTLIAIFACMGLNMMAQNLSPDMENVIDICSRISKGLYPPNKDMLKQAANDYRKAEIVDFADIRLVKGQSISLDNHLLFDDVFVDSIAAKGKLIPFASKYAKQRANRGTGSGGKIKLTTLALKAHQSATWKTTKRNIAEYAVVAEPNGLFTMTIKDEKGKVLYTETKDNKKGAAVRKAHIKLPDQRNVVMIEIKNTSDYDSSFALIALP